MAAGRTAGLTSREGRRFAFTVASAFLALAALLWWRGRPTLTTILVVLGGTLALAGMAVPGRLGPVQRAWMGFAHALSKVTTPIIMGLVYYVVLTPTGVLRRVATGSPLRARKGKRSCWVDRRVSPRGDLRRQF